MASVTTDGTGKYSTNDTHNSSGLDPTSLGILTISHILLPVVCAVFISLVVVVIACCLIQRKPKSTGTWRKKSCHTIETSHDTSDVGVYDVIDEMNVSNCTPEKTARHCTKLDTNYILGSHLLRSSKIDSTLPAAITPMGSPFQAAPNLPVTPLRYPPHPRRVVPRTDQISAHVQKSPDYLEDVNQDERVYETLDRHSLFRNEDSDHTQLPSIDRSLSFYHRDTKNISRESLQSRNTYETLNRKPESEKSCSLCSCQKDTHFKDVRQDLRTIMPSLQGEESNKIVCQLSMYKVSGGHQEKTTLIDKAYYRVQSQITPCICASSEDISTMLHNRSLRLAHRGFRDNSLDCGTDHDLILNPVCDAGGYIKNLRESNTFAGNLQKILMSQHKPTMADLQRHHDFSDQLYENWKVSNSDLLTSGISEHHINHNRGCNMSTPFKSSEVHPKHSNFTARSEATRISAKLGPLPPLPAQFTILNEMSKSHSSLHQSNDIRFGCPQAKCTTSRITPAAENNVRNQHVTSMSVCPPFETHETRPKVNILNEEVDLITCRVRSMNNRCASDLRKSGVDIPCTTGTRSIDDSTRADSLNENSNIYFILEPTGDVSGLNTDTDDTTDCQLRRNHNFR